MSDLRRYLDDDRTQPLARTLLRSAARDGLDEERAAVLARSLGVGEVAAVGQVAVGSRSPALIKVLKWGSLGIIGMMLVGVAFLGRSEAPAPRSPVVVPPVAKGAPPKGAPIAEAPVAAPAETSDAIPVALLPVAPPKPVLPRATREPVVRESPAADDLAAEVRALERIRVALAEHRVADARAGLTSYERAFPKKLLDKEARVLEIETLLADGHRDEAEALAEAFLASSPDSPYATRVRSLISAPRLP